MKTSLNHLPLSKRNQILEIVEIIKEVVFPEKIIIFGSYAKGKYVEHRYTGKDGIFYEYVSDYDFLVVTLNNTIKDYELEDCFLIWEAPLSFITLIINTDIVLRPTNTDGDALTVREGLFLGKPVIASDVVIRPVGTKLFKTRDADSLAQAIAETIGKDEKSPVEEESSNLRSYIDYYKSNVYQ